MCGICDKFFGLFSKPKKKTKLSPLKTDSLLYRALKMDRTANGLAINKDVKRVLPKDSMKEVVERGSADESFKMCYRPPMSNFNRLTSYLYLTSIGGVTQENVSQYNIIMIINATYEWPLFQNATITSYRVPVDDSEDDDIGIYFDEVSDKIQECRQIDGRCIVHCLAGASRSTTLVLAYLMKYERMSLRSAFISVTKRRECARPNIGFWRQLITYEEKTRKKTSVTMITVKERGYDCVVPDIYKESYPIYYQMAVDKQIQQMEPKRSGFLGFIKALVFGN